MKLPSADAPVPDLASYRADGIDISRVRERAEQTGRLGARPLWQGYAAVADYPYPTSGGRTSKQVMTAEDMGTFYAWLARERRPDVIVEFGTAFGISGMYWLTGLELARHGRMMTFEPNEIWADIAETNLAAISDRFTLVRGIFEEKAAATLAPRSVDIAFVDAIHTADFVYAQYDVLRPFLKPDAIVLFDDIGFSHDMRRCWQDLSRRGEVRASYEYGNRVGIVQLGPGS